MTRDPDEENFGEVFGDKVSYRCGVEGVVVVIGDRRDLGKGVRTYAMQILMASWIASISSTKY